MEPLERFKKTAQIQVLKEIVKEYPNKSLKDIIYEIETELNYG